MDDAAGNDRSDQDDARRRDAEAVSGTLAGDLRAFDSLIEAYQRRAVAVTYRLLGNINDAMDVCQDAYVRAFRSLESLEDPRKFGSWLMRIVSNLALNYRRDRRPTLSLATGDDERGIGEDALADSSGGASLNEGSMQANETQDAITAAIEQLPEKQRMALILFAIEGIPQKEVAEILECSIEAVKWNVFQARKTLKESLSEFLT
ncbi:MAG: RNA polymerase sigma factor [Planctomycetota bacterium]|nr:RNA polymerase sigma factor [Planctomycetota bacterium]